MARHASFGEVAAEQDKQRFSSQTGRSGSEHVDGSVHRSFGSISEPSSTAGWVLPSPAPDIASVPPMVDDPSSAIAEHSELPQGR